MKGSLQAVTYARVSSKEQSEEGWSIPAQLRVLHQYASNNGIEIVREFQEASTAKVAGRKAFGEMIAFLRESPEVAILVEKTDRLYRNLKDWTVIDELACDLHFVKENQVITPKSKSDAKFVHGMNVLMAKKYIDNLQEEIKKGLGEKALNGVYPSHAPLGYLNTIGPDGRRKVIALDPIRAPLVKRLFEEYDLNLHSLKTLTALAWTIGLRTKKGNRVQRSSVQAILKNPVFCGNIRWDGQMLDGTHEPLVSPELWQRVQDRMEGRNRNRTGYGTMEFAYRGLISCGCGLTMTAELKKKRYVYYHCTGRRGGCSRPFVREELITDQVTELLGSMVLPPDVRVWLEGSLGKEQEEAMSFGTAQTERLEADARRLKVKLERLYNDMSDGRLDHETYESLRSQVHAELTDVRDQLAHLSCGGNASDGGALDLLELAQTAYIRFKSASASERHELLKLMCSNCVFQDGKLVVNLHKPFDLMLKVAPISPVLEEGRLVKTDENQDWWR